MNDQWHPDALRHMGERVTEWTAGFFAGLREDHIAPPISPAAADALFDEPLPRHGLGFDAAFDEVEERVVPHSLRVGHPRYFGLMNPTPVTPALFVDPVISALAQNLGAWSHSPVGTAVEKRVIRWFCDLVGYPEDGFGTLCSGGSVANLIGLRLALTHHFPETVSRGLRALPAEPVVYLSAEAHFSFRKSAAVLGLGTEALRSVPTDRRARMDVAALRAMLAEDRRAGRRPFALVGIAGTTSSGSVDPLDDLADVAAEHALWYHVDAAWGGGALISRRYRTLLAGIHRADSVTLDPHKWFFMPMGMGAVLSRHHDAMLRSFDQQAVYIPTDEDERTDFRRYGVVGSKRFDALKLWVAFKALGADWYEQAIDRHMEQAAWLADRIAEHQDWEMLVPPDLNILCFRYRPAHVVEDALPALQDALVEAVVKDGRNWISTTEINARRAIRWMALSPALTDEDVELFWTVLNEIAAQVAPQPTAGSSTAG